MVCSPARIRKASCKGQRHRNPLWTPALLTTVCVQADLSRCPMCKVLWAVDGSFLSYKDIQGGFEELRKSGAGSAEELGTSSAAWSGVRRTPARLRRSLFF